MPSISQFFGIVITMYFNDHLPARFHAEYAEFEAVYGIDQLDILRGGLAGRAHNMVVEWASAHRSDLRADWDRAREHIVLEPIAPLE